MRSGGASGRGADLRDAAFLWLGFQLSRSKSRGVRKGPGEHAGALTWGATFAEAMVAIVSAALTRVYAFACGDNGAGARPTTREGLFSAGFGHDTVSSSYPRQSGRNKPRINGHRVRYNVGTGQLP